MILNMTNTVMSRGVQIVRLTTTTFRYILEITN
jgi:hypothetical protein